MEIDLSRSEQIKSQMEESEQAIKHSYETEWDDSVHESFYGFINDYSSNVQSINEEVEKLKEIAEELQAVDIDALEDECSSLESEM